MTNHKLILIFVVALIALTGCSALSTQTKIYDSTKGEISIPEKPRRIVTDYYVGHLLSIDAPLVGGDLTYTSPAWEDELEDVLDIGQSIEKVASLDPDLIITFNEEMYVQYQEIAPTILIPYGTFNEEEIILELGKIINQENKAKEVLADYQAEVENLLSLVDNDKLEYSIIEFFGTDPYIYGNNYGRLGYTIYNKMGLKCTTECEKEILTNPDSYALLTQENLAKYIGDVLILSVPDAKTISNNIVDSATFKATKAYKANQVYYVDSNLWYHTDMLSIMEQIEDFKEILENDKL